jgi:hypothetical protein
VSTEHLKCGWCDRGPEFSIDFILIHLDLNVKTHLQAMTAERAAQLSASTEYYFYILLLYFYYSIIIFYLCVLSIPPSRNNDCACPVQSSAERKVSGTQ